MDANPATDDPAHELGYYDILGQLGVPFFHFGGKSATERLVRLCGITQGSRVLVMGCGTGYSACHIAQTFGCQVVGLDIAPGMVDGAIARAKEMDLEDRVEFFVGNAYGTPFSDDHFDIVITEFVTQFLDKENALDEYCRVLAPGGRLGVNELALDPAAPDDILRTIHEATAGFQEAVGLPLDLAPVSQWKEWFGGAGLDDVGSERINGTYKVGEILKGFGGFGGSVKTLYTAGAMFLSSKRLRREAMQVGKLKTVTMNNRKTRRYIAAYLITGTKPTV
ncbi:MAG: methyltransferase domain-containing protein [Alphaproteobacteria bacterium]|jgi:SAM-dependent methyltransferase|nr:methyltransferase domain-containing protein [Alphaproteobacteria bacterium]